MTVLLLSFRLFSKDSRSFSLGREVTTLRRGPALGRGDGITVMFDEDRWVPWCVPRCVQQGGVHSVVCTG